MSTFKCTAVGDAMTLRRLPESYDGLKEITEFIAKGDFRFVNLETTVHNYETYGSAQSGGTWLCSAPEVLDDCKRFGFNILSTANNHAMDYGHRGLELTLEYIKKAGFQNAGVGKNLADASAPVYIDTENGRYALIGCCSSFHPEAMAGEQSKNMIGRPGINGIRQSTVYQAPKEELEHLKRIAELTYIGGDRYIRRKEGYLAPLPEGKAEFGDYLFEESDSYGKREILNEVDMKRVADSIREARYFADYVIVSMHSHQLKRTAKDEPSDFFEEFAHRCIDVGANAIVGHGPHLLRPIEIYKGCPIFYSLGDFVLQIENITKAPADMYEKQGLTSKDGLDILFDKRNAHGTKGLCYERVMYEAVIPYWEAEDGKLTSLTLLPIELGYGLPRSQSGWPKPALNSGIIERLAKMSEPYGTKIKIENGVGIVELD